MLGLFKSPIRFILGALTAVTLSVSPVFADEVDEALAALEAQLPGTLMNNPFVIKWKTDGKDKSTKIVSAEGVPGGQAYQVRVKKKQQNPWDVQVALPISGGVEAGETVAISFWARTEKPVKGLETADFDVVVQRNGAPYDGPISKRINPTTEWALYSANGVAEKGIKAGKVQVGFHMGRAAQTVEFGQFYVMNLGAQGAVPAAAAPSGPATEETSTLLYQYGDALSAADVSADAAQGGKATRFTVTSAPANAYEAGATGPLNGAINAGDALTLTFWGRKISGPGNISALIQRNGEPYESLISGNVRLTDEWAEYKVTGTSNLDLAAGGAAASFQFGAAAQTVEIGSYTVSVVKKKLKN